MRTARSSRAAMRAAVAALGLAIVPAVAVATGDDRDADVGTRASRPTATARYGSADAAEQWLGPDAASAASYGSADAAEQWLGPDATSAASYGSADAAERWLGPDATSAASYGSADAAERWLSTDD